MSVDGNKTFSSQDANDMGNEEMVTTKTKKVTQSTEPLERVAKWIRDGECQNIIVLSGAGVSVSAGIPDFRTPGTGLYDNLQKYDSLPYPEAVFDLDFYRSNPQPFCLLAKEIWPGIKHSPTLTHSFIALLAKKKLLRRNYSQNIDGLELLAKIPPRRVVECHGQFRTASCVQCKKSADVDKCQRTILETNDVPQCQHCGGHVKPDIVFFGESLPDRYRRALRRDLRKADLMLIMGTSLRVTPANILPNRVSQKCRRVLINRERVGSLELRRKKRDVFQRGDCDESVQKLCQLLGWEEELLKLNASTKIPKPV